MKKNMFTILNILTKKVKTKQNEKIDVFLFGLENRFNMLSCRIPFSDLDKIVPIRNEMGDLYFFITLDTLLDD